MFGFSNCDGCHFVNRRGEEGLCDCTNPMADWHGLMMARAVISSSLEEVQRSAELELERTTACEQQLGKLRPDALERVNFLSVRRPELSGFSLDAMRETPYGVEVVQDIVGYLSGKREANSEWDRQFANALSGYLYPDEQGVWLDAPSELFGGKTIQMVADDGGKRVLTEVLWLLMLKNPSGKTMPLYEPARPMTPLEEELALDEAFPETDGWELKNRFDAEQDRRERRREFEDALPMLLILGAVVAYIIYLFFSR